MKGCAKKCCEQCNLLSVTPTSFVTLLRYAACIEYNIRKYRGCRQSMQPVCEHCLYVKKLNEMSYNKLPM